MGVLRYLAALSGGEPVQAAKGREILGDGCPQGYSAREYELIEILKDGCPQGYSAREYQLIEILKDGCPQGYSAREYRLVERYSKMFVHRIIVHVSTD